MARLVSVLELPAGAGGARLLGWLAREGQRVQRGEPVAEVELAAGRAEVALDGAGILLRRLAVPGDWVTADLAVAIIGDEGEDVGLLLTEGDGGGAGELQAASEGERAATALAILPPRRLARPMGPADYVDRQLSPEGKRAAARAASARLDVPRAYAQADVDATDLLAYGNRLNRVLGSRGQVRAVDLVVKAAAVALRRVPQVNASYVGESIRFFTKIHVGLALALGDALVVLPIRDADLKTLDALAEESRGHAERARAGRLDREELAPPPLAVCDLGELGIDRAELVAGVAETAVLAVGRLRREPVLRGDAVAPGYRFALTLGCDERVASGPIAARFLGEVVSILEHPESLAL